MKRNDGRPGEASFQGARAEPKSEPKGLTCQGCRIAIADSFFEVDGKVHCAHCTQEIQESLHGGSRAERVLKAVLWGSLAAALGAGLWYGVRAATNLEIGLVSILIGLGVGAAVRSGCKGRGGPFYQGLAVSLTYTAVALTYVPGVLESMLPPIKPSFQSTETPGRPKTGLPNDFPLPNTDFSPEPGEERAAIAEKAARRRLKAGAPQPSHSAGKALLELFQYGAVVLGLAYAAPFLSGAENLMGILIIGFGLWEAWRLNKRRKVSIDGPHKVGDSSAHAQGPSRGTGSGRPAAAPAPPGAPTQSSG